MMLSVVEYLDDEEFFIILECSRNYDDLIVFPMHVFKISLERLNIELGASKIFVVGKVMDDHSFISDESVKIMNNIDFDIKLGHYKKSKR